MLPVRNDLASTFRLSAAIAVLLAVSAIVGLIHGGDGFYGPYPGALSGLVGQDFVSLVVGLPILLAAMWFAAQGSTKALFVWAGVLFYLAYSYYFFVVGGFNGLFPVYVLIVALSLYGLLSLVVAMDPERCAATFDDAVPRRLVGGFLVGVALLFVVMWGGMSVSAAFAGKQPDAVLHLVVSVDGTVLLPALLIAGWKLWRGGALGYPLAAVLLVKATLTGGTLAFTTALGAVWDGKLDGFNGFLLVLFGLMAVIGLGLVVPYFGHVRVVARGMVADATAGRA